jgi:antitoxin YefM
MSENVSLAEVKNHLSEYVDRVEREHERVVITKHGRPAAVVISIDDLESLEETLAIMSNPELMAQIREADADVKAGRVERLSKADVLASLAR